MYYSDSFSRFPPPFTGAPVPSQFVVQHHSLQASGNMALTVVHKQQPLTASVSMTATQRDVQLALQALSKDFTVRDWLFCFYINVCFVFLSFFLRAKEEQVMH